MIWTVLLLAIFAAHYWRVKSALKQADDEKRNDERGSDPSAGGGSIPRPHVYLTRIPHGEFTRQK